MRRALLCVPRLAVLCSALLLATGADTGSSGSEALSFLKAAEQGYASAQLNLGVLYYNGQGGRQDDKLAYAWFDVAAAQGDETAKQHRGVAAAELDPASLAEAQRLAEQYYRSYVEPFQ